MSPRLPDPDLELEEKVRHLTIVRHASLGDSSLHNSLESPRTNVRSMHGTFWPQHEGLVKKVEATKRDISTENVLEVDMAKHYKAILQDLGEDTNRQGLIKTPQRAAKALLFFTKGYNENIQGICISMMMSLYSSYLFDLLYLRIHNLSEI